MDTLFDAALFSAIDVHLIRERWKAAAMLDHPEKTPKLLAALKAVVPFEVELTEQLVKQLRAQHHAGADEKHHTVSDLSYAGDEGGIVCHIVPPEKQGVIVVSLSQVRVPRAACHAAGCRRCRLSEASSEKTQEARTDLIGVSFRSPDPMAIGPHIATRPDMWHPCILIKDRRFVWRGAIERLRTSRIRLAA